MKRNLRFSYAFVLAFSATGLFSCIQTDPNSPGYEYMPDMYYSIAYRPGEANPNYADGKTNQPPVDGTVAQSHDSLGMINFSSFPYANSPEGREKAIAELKNPLGQSAYHLDEGKRLYNVYCIACHGKEGKGDGPVVKVLLAKDNYGLQPPAYSSDQLKGISEGQIFYAMHYGKGNMGSYASQLSAVERWQITRFVQTLQNPVGGSDSTATAADTTASK
ncbi:MAG: c-type cytochrome [Flavobacteriales bacterium]|jgi:mono/diheme cytochrome c family protein